MINIPVSLKNNQGFVLAMTLWILVAITLGASFFALWANRVVVESRRDQAVLRQEVSIAASRAVLLYLLGTQRMGIDGLHVPSELAEEGQQVLLQPPSMSIVLRVPGPFISLADSAYYGINEVVFSVQDEAGLIGVNNFQRTVMQGLLSQFEVPALEQSPLIDKLLDYTDKNSLHRLNGAEAPAYKILGLPPPANRHFFSSWEVRQVMGWQAYKALWEGSAFSRLTTVALGGSPSFNTAPLRVLQAIPGIDQEIAKKIVAYRQHSPFTSFTDINTGAGRVLPLDPLGLIFFPTNYQRLSLWHPDGVSMREIHVILTPGSANGAPWLIDYDITTPLPDSVRQNPVEKSEIVFFQTEI